jgi:cytochrome P450/ferredoxin
MDDPEHARLRRTENPWSSVKRADSQRSASETIVDGRIDGMLAGPKPVNLFQEFALAVSMLVICELLSVPSADQGFCQRNSGIPIDRNATPEQKLAATQELAAYLDGLLGDKLANSGDDLLSGLAKRVLAGELTREDAAYMGVQVARAGHETIANMIALCTLALLQHLDQIAILRETDDPAVISRAVEEMLRYLTIVQSGRAQVALEDIEIDGQVIRAGDGVILPAEMADRDPAVVPDPDRPDIRRDARGHVAFALGPHQRAGQNLAAWSCTWSTAPCAGASPPCAWPPGWTRSHSRTTRASTACTNCRSPGETADRRGYVKSLRRILMKVTIDTDKCISSGQCVLSAPEVFDQRDDDGIAVLLNPAPPADAEADVRQAAALCPALAIVVEG